MRLRPPRVPFALLAWALTNDESGPAILGDLQEVFEEVASRTGLRRARFWYTREALSPKWAMWAQYSLASALSAQAEAVEGEARAELLAEAVAAYRAVLEVYTREAFPQD